MKQALALSIAVLATGCESVKVNVNCLTTKDSTVECTVQQTQGKGEVEACWDFEVTCPNGTIVKAPRMCQKVSGGGTQKTTVAADKLKDLDKCGGDGQAKAALSNLTLDGKPAQI
jgi:hypothetical protein